MSYEYQDWHATYLTLAVQRCVAPLRLSWLSRYNPTQPGEDVGRRRTPYHRCRFQVSRACRRGRGQGVWAPVGGVVNLLFSDPIDRIYSI